MAADDAGPRAFQRIAHHARFPGWNARHGPADSQPGGGNSAEEGNYCVPARRGENSESQEAGARLVRVLPDHSASGVERTFPLSIERLVLDFGAQPSWLCGF